MTEVQVAECDNNSANTWKTVRSILGWKSSGSPSQLFIDGKLLSKPHEVAEAQNQAFLGKVTKIRQNLQPPIIDPTAKLRSL